jgi:hypothetical protein
MMKAFLLVVFFCQTSYLLAQQNTVPDPTNMDSNLRQAKYLYDAARGYDAAVFNGTYSYPYLSTIEGNPYFRTQGWKRGNVVYDNVLYENIPMRYDQVSDQLIVTPDEGRALNIALFSPRVKEFSYGGTKFVRIDKNTHPGIHLEEGYYVLLGAGKVMAYERARKYIEEKVESSGISRKFFEKTRYFVVRDGDVRVIKNKADLLSALKERKTEIQQLLERNELNVKSNPEESIIAAVSLYNQAN